MSEMERVLRMVGGVGGTSYASNSSFQKKVITNTKSMVEQALADLYCSILPKSIAVVDLGCSSGPNALVAAGDIVDVVGETSHRLGHVPPEIQYFLNDLPGNDFNTLFRYLAPFKEKVNEDKGERTVPFYASGVPGSFYGRLFPKDSIHFAHSSNCLHWLSQVPRGLQSETDAPLNKQNIYLSRTSPPAVLQSYMDQFEKDLTVFLKSRSEEIISGGYMVLVLTGRGNADPSTGACSELYKLLSDSIIDMTSEGLIEEGKIDSFNVPFYTPSMEEVKAAVDKEGSFDIIQCQVSELNWDPVDDCMEDIVTKKFAGGEKVAKCTRAVMESLLVDHFGEAIIDELFSKYAQNVATNFSEEKIECVNLNMSLRKKVTRKI